MFGFAAVSSIACGLQVAVALCTFIYLVMFECSLVSRDPGLRWDEVTIVEQGRRRDEKVIITNFRNFKYLVCSGCVYYQLQSQ